MGWQMTSHCQDFRVRLILSISGVLGRLPITLLDHPYLSHTYFRSIFQGRHAILLTGRPETGLTPSPV
jgi:hypothetical protein